MANRMIRKKKAPETALDLPASASPVQMLNAIKLKRVDPKSLSVDQRRACLVLMVNGKQTLSEISEVFNVTVETIRRDMKAIREELGREVGQWSVEEVLGRLVMAAEKYQAAAMKNEDPGLAWTIERDLAKTLGDLGVVGRRQERSTIMITLDDLSAGFERSKESLHRALDPRLTGEVLETTAEVKSPDEEVAREAPKPALPLRRAFPNEPPLAALQGQSSSAPASSSAAQAS
jgi:hypothetical protein